MSVILTTSFAVSSFFTSKIKFLQALVYSSVLPYFSIQIVYLFPWTCLTRYVNVTALFIHPAPLIFFLTGLYLCKSITESEHQALLTLLHSETPFLRISEV